MSIANQVAVIGSLNIDHVARVEVLPKPGETVSAQGLELFRGGKGANQAIAAARQGSRVIFFGAVGLDDEGSAYRSELKNEGVEISHIRQVRSRTGAAFIMVDHKGENMIVTSGGANHELRGSDIERHADLISSSAVVLGQFEVPPEPLVEAARIANLHDVTVVLNASPMHHSFPWDEIRTDYAIVNESEAAELLGYPALNGDSGLIRQMLHQLRIETLIVTRGADDTLVYLRDGDTLVIPTLPVVPVDTIGAGDAFAGCFAARLASGESLTEALHAANCAGALTTLGSGSQNPIPDRERVDQHLEHLNFPI